MKLVLKFGGTSISSPSDIRSVAKTVAALAKNNEIVVVCSAINGVTDDLIRISTMIEQRNKTDAAKTLDSIIKKHKQFANQTIKSSTIKKQLLEKLNTDIFRTTGTGSRANVVEGGFNSFVRLSDFFW